MMKTSIKRIAALLLALAVMIPVGIVGAFADEPANTPTTPTYTPTPLDQWVETDGVYTIDSPEDLLALAEWRTKKSNYAGKTIVLACDIDLNPGWDASSKTAATNAWKTMWNLKATFDGQGHTIKGLCCIVNGDNASFITAAIGGTVIKNLKVENSYFSAKSGAAFVTCARGDITMENVYVDAVVEATEKIAGGLVAWYYSTEATAVAPSINLKGCVFTGSVSGGTWVGGLVGTNDRSSDANQTGIGSHPINLTDCANYATVTVKEGGLAGGLVGNCANEANIVRCYNGGTVNVGLANVTLSSSATLDGNPVVVTFEDTYYAAGTDVIATTKSQEATATVTLKYDGETATEAKTATVAELLAKDAFKKTDTSLGWVASADNTRAYPVMINEILVGHDYGEGVVTAPTCSADGYTTYTCKNCGFSSTGNPVKKLDHTPGEWIIDTPATEDFSGKKHQECSVCKESIDMAIIPALTPTETTAPADETTAAETTAAADTDATTEPEKKGCGSSIALGSALGMVSIIGLGAVALGKKRR